MDQRLNKIENNLEAVKKSVHNIDITLAVNTASLKEHMKRTLLLERIVFGLLMAALIAAYFKL